MRQVRLARELREHLRAVAATQPGIRVGLVPTMGALHEGHLSLVRRCREECGLCVVSLFVNPAQFGPEEDLAAYPRDLEGDALKLQSAGVDFLFAPEASAMYERGHSTWVEVEGLSEGLCGAFRPGHFRGVATVVAKLLNIVRPHAAYFGQKDWQQAVVIGRMARDLDFESKIVICPTVREPDGLAMSSRNAYLSPAERGEAPRLHRALEAAAREAAEKGRTAVDLTGIVRESLSGSTLRLQYVEVRRADDLSVPRLLEGRIVIAAAAFLGTTRLIDNVLIDLPHDSRGA